MMISWLVTTRSQWWSPSPSSLLSLTLVVMAIKRSQRNGAHTTRANGRVCKSSGKLAVRKDENERSVTCEMPRCARYASFARTEAGKMVFHFSYRCKHTRWRRRWWLWRGLLFYAFRLVVVRGFSMTDNAAGSARENVGWGLVNGCAWWTLYSLDPLRLCSTFFSSVPRINLRSIGSIVSLLRGNDVSVNLMLRVNECHCW